MINDITKGCVKYAKNKDVTFSYKGKKLSLDETFATFGVLPGIVKRASRFSSVCLGSSFGEQYPKEKKTHLGYKVELRKSHLPLPFIMLFIIDVLESVVGEKGSGAVIALDEFSFE